MADAGVFLGGTGLAFATTAANRLIAFEPVSPDRIHRTMTMAPLATGESIVAIDFRPLTGGLYGLSINGPNGQLVQISPTTGAITPIGAPFTISGASFGFDFNPSVDRVRVVSDTGLNLRINPDTGAVIADTPLAFVAGDVNQAAMPDVVASAYINNVAGVATTTLYGIDFTLDALVLQSPPNSGSLTTVGPLGQSVVSVAGFDVEGAGSAGFAVMSLAATPNVSTVFRVNLQTGTATSLGVVSSSELVTGFAIDAPTLLGLTNSGSLVRFNAQRPDVILSTTPLTGLSSGERMVGIDYRPITGTLFGVGSTSRVYTINPQTGVCTAVGTNAPTSLNGTIFGVDFNPTADRIRVTSDADQNLRLNPVTGALTSSDPALNPGNPTVIEVAYSNNQTGLLVTSLLGIDSASDALVSVDLMNTGVVTTVGPLGVDATGAAGFDIDLSNVGWAALQVGAATTSTLFSVDITTGVASPVGPTGLSLIGLTVIVEEAPQALVVTSTNAIIRFSVHSPQVFLQSALITGLMSAEAIVGIDARPLDGVVYAMTNQGRVYTLNPSTGVATLVSATPFTITGTDFGFDFNPVVDRVRVTSNTGMNLRLNPATGALVATDSTLTFAPGDVNQAATPSITAVAYSENFPGTRTTLYGVDSSLRALVRIGSLFGGPTSPNSGVVSTIAPLSPQGAAAISAFDIAPGGTAYLLRNNGTSNAEISVVNLATGATRLTGGLFPSGFVVQAFTVLRSPP